MEWSDLWVCHGDEHNAFASAGDFGTLRGAILVGEQHLQLHPRDVDPESVVTSPCWRIGMPGGLMMLML